MRLAADTRIRVVGINYKDQPDNARRFLGRYGNPFAATGADRNGRAAIEWGVYGVPETFMVGRDGQDRLQADRPDHAGQSRRGAEAGDREGAGRGQVKHRRAVGNPGGYAMAALSCGCCIPILSSNEEASMRNAIRAMLIALAVAARHAGRDVPGDLRVCQARQASSTSTPPPRRSLRLSPGIGPVHAAAIIKGRYYKAKDELHEKKIVTKAEYEKIRDKIIAHQKR